MYAEYKFSEGFDAVLAHVKEDFPGLKYDIRESLRFALKIIPKDPTLFEEITTRFVPGSVVVPKPDAGGRIPIIATTRTKQKPAGHIMISDLYVGHIRDIAPWTHEFAGYRTREDVVENMNAFYGKYYGVEVTINDVVSMIRIEDYIPLRK